VIFCPVLLNLCKIPASFGRGIELVVCEDEFILAALKLTEMVFRENNDEDRLKK
jgi:hypothetical protein